VDLIEARAQVARLDEQVKLLAAGADDTRRRDDLIATLVAGSWRKRRAARRQAVASLVAPTGSTWDIAGRSVAGELAGTTLRPIVHDQQFRFALAVFLPEARIVGRRGR